MVRYIFLSGRFISTAFITARTFPGGKRNLDIPLCELRDASNWMIQQFAKYIIKFKGFS